MSPTFISPHIRRRIESLGFHYDPIYDRWYLNFRRNILLNFDGYGMFLWTVVTPYYGTVHWNQSLEEFKKLKRKTVRYYIGDKLRRYSDSGSNRS